MAGKSRAWASCLAAGKECTRTGGYGMVGKRFQRWGSSIFTDSSVEMSLQSTGGANAGCNCQTAFRTKIETQTEYVIMSFVFSFTKSQRRASFSRQIETFEPHRVFQELRDLKLPEVFRNWEVWTSQKFPRRIEMFEPLRGFQEELRGLNIPKVFKKNWKFQTSQRSSRIERFQPLRVFQEDLSGLNLPDVSKRSWDVWTS